MNMQVLDASRDARSRYKVDVTRGERVGRVSSEWFSRPDDERFLSLGDLARTVRDRADHSRTRVVETARIHVEASRTHAQRLSLNLPGADAPVEPNLGPSASLPPRSGHRPPICVSCLRRLPASICNMA